MSKGKVGVGRGNSQPGGRGKAVGRNTEDAQEETSPVIDGGGIGEDGASKLFTYEENGLSYTVKVYEEDGQVFADITVNTGSMDVNAVYIADDNFSGDSANLPGPLNMNGGGSQFEGQQVQWDGAIPLSDPGLGPEGSEKATFLSEGDSLTVNLDGFSLDDVDFFGIRATSVNGGDSIKGVSGDPDEHGDDDATYSKVWFATELTDSGHPLQVIPYTDEDLSDDAEGTFADYVDLLSERFEDEDSEEFSDIEAVIFYSVNDEGDPVELFRLDGPFENEADLLEAYESREDADGTETSWDESDMAALMLPVDENEDGVVEDEHEEDDEAVSAL